MLASSSRDSSPYDALRAKGLVLVERGDLDRALAVFEEALQVARGLGHQDRIDLATCNHALVAIELRQESDCIGELRQVLLRNESAEGCRLAAYHLARSYELGKEFKKALFYSRIASERSRQLQRPDWIASSHNQVGDLLLADSRSEKAVLEYEAALALLDSDPSVRRGQILDNLGYCRILEGRHHQGLGLLHESHRILTSLGALRYRVSTSLDLCFAYVEMQCPEEAREHGEAALAGAKEYDLPDIEKNALFLLAEVATQREDEQDIRRYFSELQEILPDQVASTRVLVALGIRQIVNLKA